MHYPCSTNFEISAMIFFIRVLGSFILFGRGLKASDIPAETSDISGLNESEPVAAAVLETVEESTQFVCDKAMGINDWILKFQNREGNGRQGGVAVHRIIEADPIPLYSDDRYLSICFKYADELIGFKGSEEEKTRLKKNFWGESAPLQYELMHPLCFKVMAECADVLEAKEVSKMADTVPYLLISNFDLLANIRNFSRFNPGHVKATFESPLRGGLNLSKIENALRTLPRVSLVSLLELTMWDLTEWEMNSLLKERNGIEGLLKDCNGHFNLIPLLFRYSYMIPDFQRYAIDFEAPMTKWTKAIKDHRYNHDQIFIASVNMIIAHEHAISIHLSSYLAGEDVEANINFIRKLLADKLQFQKLLTNKLNVLKKWATSPLTLLIHNSIEILHEISAGDIFPYTTDILLNEDGTMKSLLTIQDEWKRIGASITGDRHLFHSGSQSRTIFEMIISRCPEAADEEIDSITRYSMNNRPLFFDRNSMASVHLAWYGREIVQTFVQEHFLSTQMNSRIMTFIKDTLKPRIQDALANYKIFESTNGIYEKMQENISAWVSFQMGLQNVANQLKQFNVAFVSACVIPSLLQDDLMRNVIEEYPNIFVYEELVNYMLENNNLGLFQEHPKILYGLGNYWEFKMNHFKSLEIDFTSIRRGIYTVPPIQLASFLKSKQGMIDDPVSFIGSMSQTKVWSVPSFAKYLGPYFRIPLLIEDFSLAKYLEIGYAEPLNASTADPISFIWSVTKWAINCEIYFQELILTEKANLSGEYSNLDTMLLSFESNYRKKIIEKAKSVVLGDLDEDLKSVYNAVIKTLQVTPLSKDRLHRFISDARPNILFPKLSRNPATLERSINNFRIFVMRYSNPSTGERDLWMLLLDVCNGTINPDVVDSFISSSKAPIYYKSLLARKLSLEIRTE